MSMIQVISHSGSGIAADRTPFYGIKLPSEVKKLVQLSKTVDHTTLRKILKCVVMHVEMGEGYEDQLTALQGPKCSQETVRALFAGMLSLLTSALRTPGLKPEIVKEDLQAIKMPVELVTDMGSAVTGSKRAKLERAQVERRVALPKMDSVRWRIDVTISNSSLHRVLEPSILMEMTLSNGAIKTFEALAIPAL
ncbi:COMM domain-containing protein 5-like isoform X2 [Halichondria panicea]|uniref:COMM domain-containing protein 5-like isoform X2 n=1 Tax=Halichondria panicea TaxID=6063 RepID=UPI00312BAAFD